MSLVLSESMVLAKTRSQDLKSVINFNCWGSGLKDISLIRQLVNVEVIGLSCNEITTLEDFAYCPKLRELILRKNNIKSIAEVAHLQGLTKLTSLWLGENPCAETTYNYRKVVLKNLPNLTVLDNIPVTQDELREIEELGNDIYEEVPYESSHSSESNGHRTSSKSEPEAARSESPIAIPQQKYVEPPRPTPIATNAATCNDAFIGDNSFVEQPCELSSLSHQVYEPQQAPPSAQLRYAQNHHHVSNRLSGRALSSQGSMTGLNGQHLNCSVNSVNYNNNILPKGGKSRNGNILSAVLCLVKELDYTSCEVVLTALHCRMEETSQ